MALEWEVKKAMAFTHGIVYTPQYMSINDPTYPFDPEELFTLFYYAENGRTPKDKQCTLVVSSYGGSCGICFALYDYLKQSKRWDTYIAGYASSMASIIFLAGRKRYINPCGNFGIHQPQGGGDVFTHGDTVGQADNLKDIMERFSTIYSHNATDKTRHNKKYFTNIMRNHTNELYRYNAKKTVKMGFAHGIKSFIYPNVELTVISDEDDE